jgi:glycogen(starch) synthase
MRVLVLSWEYPPRIVGGLGRHVDRLTEALAADGHEVHVITRDHPDAPTEEVVSVSSTGHGHIYVHRVPEYPPRVPFADLVPWVLQFNLGMAQTGVRLLQRRKIDVIHAHDWLVAYAAASLHELFGVPLVATVHATEYGRHQGYLPGEMNRLIHQIEWWLTYVARRVITCSAYMRDQVREIFELPPAKQDVVPNGVALRMGVGSSDSRRPPARPTVLFAGRLEYEKGVQTLIDAAPRVVAEHPDVRFVVAGKGTFGDSLEKLAAERGLGDRFEFLGFVDGDDMAALYRKASAVVAPSIYEPFGIVALEAMAARVPVIVGDTGGLRELVRHGENGLTVPPEDPVAIADAVCAVLSDARLAARLVAGGTRISAQRSWRVIARRTAEIYARAIEEETALREGGAVPEERPPLRLVWDASDTFRAAVDPPEEASDARN